MQYGIFNACLLSLSIMFSRCIHVVARVSISSWTIFHCTEAAEFVHFSVDTHLSGVHFWLLWIMLLCKFVNKFLCQDMFLFLSVIFLEVELLGHMITLCLTFSGNANCFPKPAVPFYTPTSNEGFHFSTSSSTHCYYFD